MKPGTVHWEEILELGKRERNGIFNYLPQHSEAGDFLLQLYLYTNPLVSVWDLDISNQNRESDYHQTFVASCISGLLDNASHEKCIDILLFKALVAAEIRFVSNFVPQESHEERLTGHLLSETLFSLELVRRQFEEACREIYTRKVNLDFHYADVAARKGERHSGADFAVIFSVALPDRPRFIKAFRFQAKKAGTAARIDRQQHRALLSPDGRGAFYVFYCMGKESGPRIGRQSPLVLPAQYCAEEIKNASMNVERTRINSNAEPFSAFLVLHGLSSESGVGRRCGSLEEAANYVYGIQYPEYAISRLLVVSVGGGAVPRPPSGGDPGSGHSDGKSLADVLFRRWRAHPDHNDTE